MDNNERALNTMKRLVLCGICTGGECKACDRYNTKEMALAALEKQVPMGVKEIHLDEYYCPACGSENTCNDGQVEDDYCPACGQRLIQSGGAI